MVDMENSIFPHNELERLQALRSLDVLDTGLDPALQSIVEMAGDIAGTPISLISLVDSDRQWFKANMGLDAAETPRDVSFCTHSILQDGIFEIENATEDSRFRHNPLVTGGPGIQFYAGAPLRTTTGYNIGTLCVIDRKPGQLSEEARRALTRLADLTVRTIELTHKAEARVEEKSLDVSRLAHEIRTPLNHIVGFANLARHQLDSGGKAEKIADYLALIQEGGEHLNRIVERILSAGEESRPEELACQPVAAGELASHVAINFAQALEETRQRIEFSGPETEIMVDADPTALRQVLSNLVSNASKYAPDETTIRVGVRVSKRRAVAALEVSDEGPGMPEQVLRQLGREFVRSDSARESDVPGTGLGLHIVKRLVEEMGGQLHIENPPRGGCRAIVYMPLIRMSAVRNGSVCA